MRTPIFLSPVSGGLQRVDEVIRARLDSDVALVRQIADYIIAGGGKRLRPALVLMAADAAGYRGEAHYELAAVVVEEQDIEAVVTTSRTTRASVRDRRPWET